jgi:hypothetical protein
MSRINPAHYLKFKRYVREQANGCWLWTGEGTADGYGLFRNDGKRTMTHIWAYQNLRGDIPTGMQVDHACHTQAVQDGTCSGGEDCPHRRCCRPEHLELVTASENTLRQNHANRAKTTCPQGHPLSGDNLIVNSDGKRRCRECVNARKRRVTSSTDPAPQPA